ncbi:MAG: YceK/YidQ family lipoprotein [Gammaproteobacteria bacterium]
MMRNLAYTIILAGLFVTTGGCATYRTLDAAGADGPKFFSGTRLDVNSINKDKAGLKKFKVDPPKYPLLDVPPSFMLDLMVSPATGIMRYAGSDSIENQGY